MIYDLFIIWFIKTMNKNYVNEYTLYK